MSRDETLYSWLRLALEPNLTPSRKRALLAHAGLPEDVYALGHGQLLKLLDPVVARQLASPPSAELAAAIDAAIAWAEQPQHHILTLADTSYPAGLLEIHDPPLVLYVVGDLQRLALPAIAIVGSRSATPGGCDNAHAFAQHLAQAGWCVVSGLATGIDAAAHEGALAAGAEGAGTIAVIATGADLVYPARHRELAHRIAAQGAIVSELPLGTRAERYQFPRRNRLIAGLARGVLVVEAALQSGSLITARLAGELGREVFAIPGSIHSPLARGCHALIRQGAKLTETAEDILSELGMAAGTTPGGASLIRKRSTRSRLTAEVPEPVGPGPEFLKVHDAVSTTDGTSKGNNEIGDPAAGVLHALGFDPVHIDDLQRRTGLAMPALHAALLQLELDAQVVRLDGGRYQRRGA